MSPSACPAPVPRKRGRLTSAVWFAALTAAMAAWPSSGARAETPIPDTPSRWVTDNAGFLSPVVVHELDARLQDYEKQSGHQVIVFIDHTTGGVPIEDWSVRAFKKWGVGRRGSDDGLALLIFSDDHHLRLEVGYGLEGQLPDARAARIIQDLMVPRIRAGDRDGAVRGGVDAALAALGGAAEGARSATDGTTAAEPPPNGADTLLHIIAVLFGSLFLLLFIAHPLMGLLGLLHIGPPGWRDRGWGGGGGFSSGDGFGSSDGGGSGGGGGFSGGGGSSGGGGASGSW